MDNPEANETRVESPEQSSVNYAKLLAEAKSEVNSETETSPLGETTKPESRRYEPDEPYRFLVHAAVQRHPEEIYGYLTQESSEAGFQLTEGQLNTSLIDHAHTATFVGEGGFIIAPPRDAADIRGAYAADVGSQAFTGDAALPTPEDLLAATKPGEYNQVNITAGKVEGVFLRVAADTGGELGDARRNAALRQLAVDQGLPIAEIAVQPRELHVGPPRLEAGGVTDGGGQIWHVEVPREGFIYKLDVMMLGNGDVMPGYASGEYAVRAGKVDKYDGWDQKLSETEVAEVQDAAAAMLSESDSADQATHEALRHLGVAKELVPS